MKGITNRKVEFTIYIITMFILGLIFGRLFIEQIKLDEAQKKISNIEAEYNELTERYEELRNTYKNEI